MTTCLPDPHRILTFARLCDAAYEVDALDSVNAITKCGEEFELVAQVIGDTDRDGEPEISITVIRSHGGLIGECSIVVISGTPIEKGFSLDGTVCNLTSHPTKTEFGDAMSGYWDPLARIWPAVTRLLPPGEPVKVIGHSMGGARAYLAPALWWCDEVAAFGAPSSATAEFWSHIYGPSGPILHRIVCERDVAPTWPWGTRYVPPCDMIWIRKNGAAAFVSERPGINLSLLDSHSLIGSYVAASERWARG